MLEGSRSAGTRLAAVQLRAKGASPSGLMTLARELGPRALEAGVPLVMNDAPQPAYCGLPGVIGVHLGQEDVVGLEVAALIERARTGQGGFVPALLMVPLAMHCGVWAWVGMLLIASAVVLPRTVSRVKFWMPWVLGGVLLAGAFAVSRGWSSDPLSLAPQPGRHGLLGPGGAVVRAATPASLWWPSAPAFVDEGDLLMRGEHLGIVASGLAALGLWIRRDRLAAWTGAILVTLAAWSLGPWVFGRLNPVYAVSVWVVPLLGAWPEPGQLTMPLVLLLTAVVGASWSRLPDRRLQVVLLVMLVGERWLALPPLENRTDTATDAVWDALSEEGVVATIPRDLPGRRLTPGLPFIAQMGHHQPIAASVFPGVSRWDDWSVVSDGASEDWQDAGRCLRQGGIRYIAFHRAWMQERLEPAVEQLVADQAVELGRGPTWVLVDLQTAPDTGTALPPFQPLGAAPRPPGWLPPAPLPVGIHTVDRTGMDCPVDRFTDREP